MRVSSCRNRKHEWIAIRCKCFSLLPLAYQVFLVELYVRLCGHHSVWGRRVSWQLRFVTFFWPQPVNGKISIISVKMNLFVI